VELWSFPWNVADELMEIVLPGSKTSSRISSVFSATGSYFWLLCADIYPVLIAACIPWSTTAVAGFVVLWLIVLAPTINPTAFLISLKRPACWLPLALFALAVVGTLWGDGPWSERFLGIHPVAKLLLIPLLLYHFERSARGQWVFGAFLISCIILLGRSWFLTLDPGFSFADHAVTAGIPVKNSIDQSQEFGLCIFGLSPLVITSLNERRFAFAALCMGLILAFFLNLTFVVLARSSLIYMPVLLMFFVTKYLSRPAALALVGGAIATAFIVWFCSPYFQRRVEGLAVEYRDYKETHRASSTGQRLEWWGKSIDFIGDAPLFGNGTGSTKQLFDHDAAVQVGTWSASIGNPHNQTLNVAIQWGVLGSLLLYAMWCSHLLLFGAIGLASWIGLIVVVQNFVSSLFNSHLFDFTEGWIYVLGVGVAGGVAERLNSSLLKPNWISYMRSEARTVGRTVTAIVFLSVLGVVSGIVGFGLWLIRHIMT
jgi:O-antigen ligase